MPAPNLDHHFLLNGRRYIHPKMWNGVPWVEIKYFQQNSNTGQLQSRKGGICLSLAEWEALIAHMPMIQTQLQDLTKTVR